MALDTARAMPAPVAAQPQCELDCNRRLAKTPADRLQLAKNVVYVGLF
jgi:hypothetical protein